MGQNSVTIYMTEQDKEAAEKLKQELFRRGLKQVHPNKKFGVSELFRYLVQQELKKVTK